MEFIKAITASIAAKDTVNPRTAKGWDKNVKYEIPIKSIDGIPVGTSVEKQLLDGGKLRLYAKIWHNDSHFYYEHARGEHEDMVDGLWSGSYPYAEEEQLVELPSGADTLTDAVTKMIQDIRELSFCHWTGLLKTKTVAVDLDAWEGLLSSVSQITLRDKCCVCYNATMGMTQCGHSLCFKCFSSIPTEDGFISCPMCRQDDVGLIRC